MFKKILFFVLLINVFSCKSKKESAEFFNRGNYHFKKNELEQSLHFYKEAIKKADDFADAYNNRGVVYEKMGDLDLAKADFKKAVELDNTFIDAKFNLARSYFESNQAKESFELFTQIEDSLSTSSVFYNYFGKTSILLNKNDKAQVYFEKSINLNPKNTEAITNLGYLFTLENENGKAAEMFEKALKINPNFAPALLNLGVIKARHGNLAEGIELLKKAEEINPNDIIIQNNLSFFYFEKGNIVEGKKRLELARKINPEDWYLKRNEAILLLQEGKTIEAKEIFMNIEKSNPDVEFIYYFLGKTSLLLKNKADACAYFKTGIALKDGRSLKNDVLCGF